MVVKETKSVRTMLVLCTALMVLPVIYFEYFPNQDGSAHVNSALVLAKLAQGSAFFSKYFTSTHFVLTNWATTAILFALNYLLEPAHMESAFALLYVILMVAAIVFCVRHLFLAPSIYALVFFPLVFTHMLHMGSFNLSLACIPFLPLLGLCHQYLVRPSGKLAVWIALILLLIFTLHVQIAILALCCAGIYAGWVLGFTIFAGSRPFQSTFLNQGGANLQVTDAVKLIGACLPAGVACLLFFLEARSGLASEPHYVGLKMKGIHLVFLSGIASYSVFGMAVAALLFLLIAAGCGYALRTLLFPFKIAPADCMLACALFVLMLFIAMPDGLGDAFNIEERLMIPMLMALLGWIVLRIEARIPAQIVVGAAVAIILLQTADRALAFAKINDTLKEYAEVVPHIPDGAAIIVINLDQVAERPLHRNLKRPFEAVTRFDAARSFMGTAIGDRDVAFISNYEALAVRPYFSLKYEPWLSTIIGNQDPDPVAKDEANKGSLTKLIRELKNGGPPISYLALWTVDRTSLDDWRVEAALATIEKYYDKTFSSSASHLSLYKMKEPPH
ncbi:MAG: hypothetical protein M3N08_00405 [Pseudomonadota bacterium]|nr:hypothetical protein [Pseudomonadota bacterium]